MECVQDIEREKYNEQRYCEYITEEDNRWLLQLVEEIEHESNKRKFMNDTMKTLSLGGTIVVTKVKSDHELMKSRILKNENRCMKRKCAFSI